MKKLKLSVGERTYTGGKELREIRGEVTELLRPLCESYEARKQKRDNGGGDEIPLWEGDEQARFDALMLDIKTIDGLLAEQRREAEAIAERFNRGGLGSGGSGPVFKDLASGREIRALLPSEQMASLATEGRRMEEPISVGRCLQAVLLNQPEILTDGERRALLGGVDSAGGYLLNPMLGTSVLDLARSASVMMRAGALTIPMDGAELNLARLATDATSYWRAEGVAVTASEPTFNRVTLRPKTLACIVPVSIELLEDCTNIGQVLEMALQNSMAQKLDEAALTGDGAGATPIGVLNTSGVTASTSVGTPSDFSKFSGAVASILGANFPGEPDQLSWVMNPTNWATIDLLKEGTTNAPLRPTAWVEKLRRLSTTSLTAGNGLVGDFSQVLIGMRTRGVVIRVLDAGSVIDASAITHNAASELKKLVVAYLRADVAVMRPSWFTALTGITTG